MHALSITRSVSKITRSAISRKPINQNPQKNLILDNIFEIDFDKSGVLWNL